MDLSSRRWGASAVLSLLAAGLLALAAFLPLFVGDSNLAAHEPDSGFSVRATGLNGGLGIGYQQLFGAAVALIAGVLAAIAVRGKRRKGGLVLLVVSAALNLGVAAIVGSFLTGYFSLYPAFDGPEGQVTADLGVGVWCLCAGLLLAFAAAAIVLTPVDMDLTNRRWGSGAVLSLVAAALLTLAVFLPHFHVEWDDPWGLSEQNTANAWGITQTTSMLPARPYGPQFSSGSQLLFGAALALAAGLLALVAARRSGRGRAGSMVLLLAAGPFNLGFAALLVTMLSLYFRMFPATSRSGFRLFDIVLGAWCLFLGVLFSLLASVAVLGRKPVPAPVPTPA